MSKFRILFMGTPDFAVATLRALLSLDHKVVGVLTAPDRPAGRGQKLKASAVKIFAQQHQLPVLQPTNLKSPETIAAIQELNPNLSVVVAFRMLPKVIWRFPKYGTFNLHASLLPAYRGAAPIHWAIIQGETQTGITTFLIDEKIDTGNILLQQPVDILPDDNVGTLHDKLMLAGAELVVQTIAGIETNTLKPQPQPKIVPSKTAYKLHKQNTKIDWNSSPTRILNLVRGLNPYPTAWTYCKQQNKNLAIKIYEVDFQETVHQLPIGTLNTQDFVLKVAIDEGFILIKKLQIPGKRAMDTKSLLLGFQFTENALFV